MSTSDDKTLDNSVTMTDPLGPLVLLAKWPYAVFPPPYRDNIKQVLRERGIRIWINAERSGLPTADPASMIISLGRPFLERLWAHVYAQLAILEWDERHQRPASLQPFFSDSANAPALDILRWAVRADRVAFALPWPQDLPRPPSPSAGRAPLLSMEGALSMLDPSLLTTFEGRVTRLFLHSLAWMVLHEAGHLILGHSPSTEAEPLQFHQAHLQEVEADHFATSLCVGAQDPETEGERRSVLGVVIALCTLVSYHLEPIYRQLPSAERAHADDATRLRRFLLTFFPHGGYAWRAASVLCELHLRSQNLPAPESVELGTDEHLRQVWKIIGGAVVEVSSERASRPKAKRQRRQPGKRRRG